MICHIKSALINCKVKAWKSRFDAPLGVNHATRSIH